MTAKAMFLSAALVGLGLSVTDDASAKYFKKKPPAARNVPELSAKHAAVPATLLLAGIAVVAGRRRKQRS